MVFGRLVLLDALYLHYVFVNSAYCAIKRQIPQNSGVDGLLLLRFRGAISA